MVSKIIPLKVQLLLGLLAAATVLLWPGSCVSTDLHPTLRMQLANEPVTLDFSLSEDGISFQVLSALMTGLVSYDHDYQLKYEIADKMERLDGGRRYRFTLKPWKWSDGKPVTADDFVFSMQRTLSPATPSKLADLLFPIKGAEAFKRGNLKDFSKVGITAVSDDVLEFVLEKPVSFFPHILTLPIGYPQREDVIQKYGAQWAEHMVSTGPYKLTRWIHDQRIEIEQNQSYPIFDSAAPRRALFQIIPEEAAALNLFENNRLDVLFKAPSFDVERLRKRGVIREFPYFATYYIAFDQRKQPWKDRNARLAVAQAINKKLIVDALGVKEAPAGGWIPMSLPGFNASIGVKHDPALARENWRRSGGGGLKSILLGYDTSSRNQTVMERIQSDLKEYLSVQVQLKNRDWKTYVHELSRNPPPMYRFGWLSPFVDAYANLVVFHSDNPNNYTGWKNKRYDALLRRIEQLEQSDPLRQKLIDEAQKILIEESVTVVPVFHYVQTLVVSPRVRELWVNGMGMVDYMKVRIH